MNSISSKLISILKLLPNEGAVEILKEGSEAKLVLQDGRSLLSISQTDITIPNLTTPYNLFNGPSPLKNDFVPQTQIERFFEYLAKNNLYRRLNHMGICYFVESVSKEKERLIEEVGKTNWHLYEEASNDGSPWLFLGNTKNWQDPLLEILPVENTKDRWINYWLPHIQIDIDTYLNGDEIEKLVVDNFQGKIKPWRVVETEKFIMLVRARLGVVSGVNINLDLGFEGIMQRYHRKNLLNQLV